MSEHSLAAALPGDFRQIGYVVRDLDASIAAWLSLGIGPFYVMRNIRQDAIYRGQPCSISFSVAFANNGDLQIELIHQHDETPSIYTEFLDSGHEGMNQLAWWAPDFPATIDAITAAGWSAVWSGGGDGQTRYAYFEIPRSEPATIIEIMELNDMSAGLASLVRSAAAGWDGSDPIRRLA
jgi:Glyoxalase/Bleomycin resistance protein/Dioxygenase superfamily